MRNGSQQEQLLPPLWVLVGAVFALAIWLLVQLKEIFVLLLVGYCIAYVIEPLLRKLERRRVPRHWGIAIVASAALAVLALLAVTTFPTLGRQYERLATNFPSYVDLARDRAMPLFDRVRPYLPPAIVPEELLESPLELLKHIRGETVQKILGAIYTTLLGGYSVTLTIINLLLLPFIVYYLAIDFPELHRRALAWFPVPQRRNVAEIGREIDGYVSAFVGGQLTVAIILFCLYALGLGVIGVDLWLVLAAIAGFGNFIPYFGFLIGIVLSTVMALVTFASFGAVVKVWAVFAVVQFLEGSFITPKIVGEKVGISPLAVILALVAGGKLFGLLGILLAVPVAAALRVLINHGHRWVLKRSAA